MVMYRSLNTTFLQKKKRSKGTNKQIKERRNNLEHYGQKNPHAMETSIQVKKSPMLNKGAFTCLQVDNLN